MNKINTLSYCRYYKGSGEFDFDKSHRKYDYIFWQGEKLFVETEGTDESAESVKFYLDCGLVGANEDLPIELLACLFQMYCKGADNSPETLALYFKIDVLPNYLAQPQ